uniref:Ankyrin-1 n=1 Tax=Magallana gigas TaxID=29159 RepID=K1PQ35_MAGGI
MNAQFAIESPVDRAIFMQWQDDNKQFVSTRACKEVEKLIQSQNLVIVTGNSGSGKSAIIQHIALCFRSQGWTVKPVYNVKEIIDTYSSVDVLQRRILFVFNDPIGNESFDEIAYNLWKEHDERLKAFLRNSKMLLSSRKYILLDYRVRGMLNDESCIIDLSDDKHKLNNVEKENILKSYSSNSGLSKKYISGILMTEEYFPLLCKLYFSDKNNQTIGPRFFKEPFNVCQEQIRNFRKECKENYCALVLLVLCNNQLCVEDIHINDSLREKFELALKLCEMKTNTASQTIGDALKTLEGFFVKKIEDTYYFYHDFVMEVTTYVFGTDYPKETIQYADIGFLRRRVNFKSSNDIRNEEVDIFTIYLNDNYVSDLADRLFNDVFGDGLLDVVLNPCMKNEKVATCFIQKLKDRPEKLHNLLAKKKLHEKFRDQKDNQELKQSFRSKLQFLYYVDKVPILSAIIIFCHTNVSKHCLETLQRMRSSLKDTSLFSAVCCNGSMELFNVFPKEQIKWFLVKKGWEFYPIHIVSLFHNHEILRALIQVKNNVNLKTSVGFTPLMFAVFNADPSEKINTKTKNQPIDITVELLLTHGADINFCDPLVGSPLHIASREWNDHTVELLLDKGADINSCDKDKETILHKASKTGHEGIVQFLLDKGADINSCDTKKETPLHKASEEGHEGIVQLLLDKGAVINSCDKNEKTPLHKASAWGRESTVQLLLDKGADINSCDTNKETPLHKASEEGHESTVQLLLDKEADINSCDTNKETPLHKASEKGHESTVQLLLDKGANINACDINKENPLHKASKWGHESTVQLLLDKGAYINSCYTHKDTLLSYACEGGHESTVQRLLDKGADINSCDTNKETPLHKAIEGGHESIVQLLLDKGADINSCDTNKETPLHKASEKGHESTVQFLLDKGADIHSCDTNKETPLHKASEEGHESTVQLLLDKGANINSCDINKETPLHKASEWGHESTVQRLLDKGADINSCDTNKETPLHKAIEWGNESTVQLLLDKGADINSCDSNKETPLHKASKEGLGSTVQLLLDKGANINSCDTNKETPLHKASRWGRESIVQLLLDKGAIINSCDTNKETPLHKASKTEHESTEQHLLEKEADTFSCDTNKETPFH